MLAAIEDLLDSWPGTLIVVSHDRYFLERVTDQQYGIFDHQLRHLPGGVDEYLKRRGAQVREREAGSSAATASLDSAAVEALGERRSTPASAVAASPTTPALSGRELRDAQKELASVERRMERLGAAIAGAREGLATLDQMDYQLLNVEMSKITAIEDELAELEERWLELSEQLG